MNSKVEIKTKEDHGSWYDNNIDPYKGLAEIIAVTLKNSLISQQISFVDVPYRSKTKKSFLKKIEDKLSQKDYSPELMTDLAGIRVITLIEADVQKVGDLIQSMFHVHKEDSVNKSEKLGEEKVGYRSVHFVCDVGQEREQLPEFSAFKKLCFEIQVRTALEHAWAEIEHDRGYKLGGKLPSHLNRRFKLLSGLLESADLEFNRLTVEIEEYANQLKRNIDKKEHELSTIGLKTLIFEKYPEYLRNINDLEKEDNIKALKELNDFGVGNLRDLDQSIKEIKDQYEFPHSNTTLGFVREIMLLKDIERYFNDIYSKYSKKDTWHFVDEKGLKFLMQKYEKEELLALFEKYNIKVE